MKKKRILSFILAAALLGMAGCGDQEETRRSSEQIIEDNKALEKEEENVTVESTKKTEYPLTITTYGQNGTEYTMTYEKAPEKVVAVYQGAIETLLALGLEDRIVATAGLDNEVPDEWKAAFSSTEYLDEFTPSKETVMMLEPDMIFSWASLFGEETLGSPDEWAQKGTNVYINTNTAVKEDTLENEYQDILTIGKIFDVQDRAESLVDEMRDTVNHVKELTKEEEKHASVMVLESMNGSFTNYGSTSIAGDMVTQLGGELSVPDSSTIGKEDLLTADPDVIFVVYMPYSGEDPDTVKKENLAYILEEKSFQNLSAVKNGRVIPIMLSEMYASATRTQDGIETIAKGLYPDLKTEK